MNKSTNSTRKVVAIDQFGGIEKMKVQTLSIPEILPGEILVRVESAGVGVWDPLEREGFFAQITKQTPSFPYILGSDGAGTVVAVGGDVSKFKEGDQIYGFSSFDGKTGFYSEYAILKADSASLLPPGLSLETAGAMPVDAMTALRGLDDSLHLKSGETVMIFGASGGIGHLALQLARRMGVRVFAVASGADGVAFANRLGADVVVDGRKDDVLAAARAFAPDGLDAALLTAGGETAENALTAVKKGGRVAYPARSRAEGASSLRYQSDRLRRLARSKVNRKIESIDPSRPIRSLRREELPAGRSNRSAQSSKQPTIWAN